MVQTVSTKAYKIRQHMTKVVNGGESVNYVNKLLKVFIVYLFACF